MTDLSLRGKLRKVLYSPGFGAGWTTWEGDIAVKRLMLDYAPIIEAIDRGETITEDHPAVITLLDEIKLMGKNAPYLGGLRDIEVGQGSGRVRVDEYDGNESLTWEGEDADEWL